MVHQMASRLQDLELVEIASLLHDIQDWKYSGSETAAATTVKVGLSIALLADCTKSCQHRLVLVQKYLQQHSYPEDRQTAVLDIIQGVGFKVPTCSLPAGLAAAAVLLRVQRCTGPCICHG